MPGSDDIEDHRKKAYLVLITGGLTFKTAGANVTAKFKAPDADGLTELAST
jgi:hypothetical protein